MSEATTTLTRAAANPAQGVVIDDFSERWFPVSILAALGVAFAGAGSLARVLARGEGRAGGGARAPRSYEQRRRAHRRRDLLIAAAPVAMGCIVLAIAGGLFVHERRLSSEFVRTTGQVVDMQERVRRLSSTHLTSAIVVFKTAAGQRVTFVQGSSSSDNTLSPGDMVAVLYDPANPQRAVIDQFWERWDAFLILCAIGVPLVGVGLYFLFGMTVAGSARGKR